LSQKVFLHRWSYFNSSLFFSSSVSFMIARPHRISSSQILTPQFPPVVFRIKIAALACDQTRALRIRAPT
jgi:hypothetical protein